jgi:hypothetical protein
MGAGRRAARRETERSERGDMVWSLLLRTTIDCKGGKEGVREGVREGLRGEGG